MSELGSIYEKLKEYLKEKSRNGEMRFKEIRTHITWFRIEKTCSNKIINEMLEEGLLIRENNQRVIIK